MKNKIDALKAIVALHEEGLYGGFENGSCTYMTESGHRCAIGAIISDEAHRYLERHNYCAEVGITTLFTDGGRVADEVREYGFNEFEASVLQSAHDLNFYDEAPIDALNEHVECLKLIIAGEAVILTSGILDSIDFSDCHQ